MPRTIAAAVGEPSFVARVSGDEFVALVDAKSRERISEAAAALIAAMKEPLVSHGHTISTGLSVGIAYADGPDTPVLGLLRNAALALDEAKRRGRRRAVTFNDAMATSVERRRRLEQDLTGALKKGEIEVEYQPIHRASDGAMIGAEALARWKHPELGAISPVEFVAVAEETGQILQLGERILRIALNDARDWDGVYVSVNLSPVQFRLADLAQQVGAMLNEHAYPAPRLQLEVTEGVLLHDIEAAREQIEALRSLGIRVALDDFGTGYSSLSYLRSLPFDKVKIDRAFVNGLSHDTTNRAIVQCIVALARELDMLVTAEGVESEADATLLRAAGCNSFQGYLFGKPMPAAAITERLSPAKQRAAAG